MLLSLLSGDCSVRALNGQCCILPFKYNGKVYNNCTRDGSDEAWCAVRFPFIGNETDWRQDCTSKSVVFEFGNVSTFVVACGHLFCVSLIVAIPKTEYFLP